MTSRTIATIVCSVILTATAFGTPTQYVEGEAIVTFRESVSVDATQQALTRRGLTMPKHFAWLSARQQRQMGLVRAQGRTTAALIAELQRDPLVETAEPNYLRWVSTIAEPNDPYFGRLWGLQNTGQVVNGTAGTSGADIKFREAWTLARPFGTSVVVAVIDTGIDYAHPDLVSNMWVNPGEIAGNGVDDDGNGYVDDVSGYDFADGDPHPTDSSDHGTHVAGTIAATGNNQTGVIGVQYNAKIMALRASTDGITVNSAAVIEALQYATMMKSRGVNIAVINSSYGGGGYVSAERAAIQTAGNAGIALCAAAGNDSLNNDSTPVYPASYRLTNMIVVAASTQNDGLASFSNYGATTVDLAAPGDNIFSTLPTELAGTTSWVERASTVYPGNALSYAGVTTGITAAIVDCGLGYRTNFPPAVAGNIALIKRGTLYFTEKVGNAMAAGALAAIIDNNTNGNFLGTLQYSSNWIPAVGISLEDGAALRATLPTTGTVVNFVIPTQIYQYLDGTSMATPHVAGAVAFAAMNLPAQNVTQRVQRVMANVDAKAALSGKVRTGGRLNLLRIVDADANGLPDWWELDNFGMIGVNLDADLDLDGFTNYAEFIAGTNPQGANSFLTTVSAVPEADGFRVTWASVPGRSYAIWYTNNLKNTWQLLVASVPAAAGTTTSWVDTNAAGLTRRFYRVQALPP